MESNSFYDLEATAIDAKNVKMSDYKGKVVLIVNTASKCGFTNQYEGLEKLYQNYKDQGLVVMGFPCNQFRRQEPASEHEIQEFCKLNYGVSFPLFAKVDVNGAKTHPVYKFLKKQKPGLLGTENIKWNFTKFLIDKDGQVIERYSPDTKPENITGTIEKLLGWQ